MSSMKGSNMSLSGRRFKSQLGTHDAFSSPQPLCPETVYYPGSQSVHNAEKSPPADLEWTYSIARKKLQSFWGSFLPQPIALSPLSSVLNSRQESEDSLWSQDWVAEEPKEIMASLWIKSLALPLDSQWPMGCWGGEEAPMIPEVETLASGEDLSQF